MTPATPEQIVAHFVEIDDVLEALRYNWNTNDRFTQGPMWDIADTNTYINGILMMIDADSESGFLLECVERDTGVVSYIAIATFSGKCNECGAQAHAWLTYPDYCGVYSDRELESIDAVLWAAAAIDKMFKADDLDQPWDPRVRRAPEHLEGCLFLDDGLTLEDDDEGALTVVKMVPAEDDV